jgi:hypothetical protein
MATKPFLSQIAVPVGTTTGDVYYPQTSLLMHFNGTNGSTTMTDNSKNNLTVTSNNGAAITTAESKFGGTSVFFDGTNDYLSIANNTPLVLSGGSYTIECWIRPTGNYTNYNTIIAKRISGTGTAAWEIYLRISTGVLSFYNGTNYESSVTPTVNVWSHIAAVYNGSTINLYLNGVNVLSSATGNSDVDALIYIGSFPSAAEYFIGYIDELRVTKGIARYTGNFTPSTTQFLDSTGDANSTVVVNSTATGFAIGTGGINGAQLAKAWVNFDGIGTVSIRDSYSVSSITDLGTGTYDVNFSSTFSTIPTVVASTSNQVVNTNYGVNVNSHTTSKVQIYCTENGVTTDKGVVSVIVFRN